MYDGGTVTHRLRERNATQTGVRIIVPLTDNWNWYHGAKISFVRWVDPEMPHADTCLPPLSGNVSVAALCPFYTDRRIIAAFKVYIKRLLEHVSVYSGRALKDEPAVMGWETGNEVVGVAMGEYGIKCRFQSNRARRYVRLHI
jgi:mannan endo-1,4-beta-mannosidase